MSGVVFHKKCSKVPGYPPCYSSYSLKSVREYPKIAVCGTNYPDVDGGYRLLWRFMLQSWGTRGGTLPFAECVRVPPKCRM